MKQSRFTPILKDDPVADLDNKSVSMPPISPKVVTPIVAVNIPNNSPRNRNPLQLHGINMEQFSSFVRQIEDATAIINKHASVQAVNMAKKQRSDNRMRYRTTSRIAHMLSSPHSSSTSLVNSPPQHTKMRTMTDPDVKYYSQMPKLRSALRKRPSYDKLATVFSTNTKMKEQHQISSTSFHLPEAQTTITVPQQNISDHMNAKDKPSIAKERLNIKKKRFSNRHQSLNYRLTAGNDWQKKKMSHVSSDFSGDVENMTQAQLALLHGQNLGFLDEAISHSELRSIKSTMRKHSNNRTKINSEIRHHKQQMNKTSDPIAFQNFSRNSLMPESESATNTELSIGFKHSFQQLILMKKIKPINVDNRFP